MWGYEMTFEKKSAATVKVSGLLGPRGNIIGRGSDGFGVQCLAPGKRKIQVFIGEAAIYFYELKSIN
jgi:hypothetical protein